jgi:hypothetical protein
MRFTPRARLTCPICQEERKPSAKAPAVRCDLVVTVDEGNRRRRERRQGPICAGCADTDAFAVHSIDGRVVTYLPSGELENRRCDYCGMQVMTRPDPHDGLFVCSDDCRRALR